MGTTGKIGVKYDSGKPLFSLIPPHALEEVAKVLTKGAEKYAPDNWKKVPHLMERYEDAAGRHLNSFSKGDYVDDETGLEHLAHAACCLLFMLETRLTKEIT